MAEFTESEIRTFCRALCNIRATLSENQQQLLYALVWFARQATADTVEQLVDDFELSFTPEQASLLVDYSTGATGVDLAPRIFRGFIKYSTSDPCPPDEG